MAQYPMTLRRLRQNEWVRDLTREVHVSSRQLIQPLFAVEGLSARESVPGLTGVFRETEESLLRQVEADFEAGIHQFLLFGVPKGKKLQEFDYEFTARSIENLKKRFGRDLFLAVDVCFCSYTSHGQCGILTAEHDHLENDNTVTELAKAALCYATAGADCVAPSDMMDGRVKAIRTTLDQNTQERTLILSYSAKFHSRFYGPFRVAADSAPKGGSQGGAYALKDRATYQIDPARASDALLSSRRDAEEGADMLMVKPALPYLDILSQLSREIPLPWAAYEVSGEYAAIEVLAERGLILAREAHLEAWTAIRRAGASMIITYGARNARKWGLP